MIGDFRAYFRVPFVGQLYVEREPSNSPRLDYWRDNGEFFARVGRVWLIFTPRGWKPQLNQNRSLQNAFDEPRRIEPLGRSN